GRHVPAVPLGGRGRGARLGRREPGAARALPLHGRVRVRGGGLRRHELREPRGPVAGRRAAALRLRRQPRGRRRGGAPRAGGRRGGGFGGVGWMVGLRGKRGGPSGGDAGPYRAAPPPGPPPPPVPAALGGLLILLVVEGAFSIGASASSPPVALYRTTNAME